MTRVKKISSRRDLRRFVRFPERLYADCDFWSPPLWSDEFKGYQRSNPVLANCEFELYLAFQDGKKEPVGRIMVYLDPGFNQHEERNSALFGAFDTIDDKAVSQALLDAATGWAQARGADDIVGPINPVAEYWGILTDGFDEPAMFLTPYNFAYYAEHLESAGFGKEVDLLAYEADAKKGYGLPQRYDRFLEIFSKKNPQFSVRRFDLKNLNGDAAHIHKISNIALSPNWGYVPVSEEVMLDMVGKLKPILDPDAIWFVEKDGEPVGFCLGWPDFNIVLKRMGGNLFPFGWTHLFRTLPKVQDYRLFGLAVLPEYHGMGLDALLYIHLFQALYPRNIRLEANFVLEHNAKIRNALERLGMEPTKTYRMYNRAVS